MIKIIKKEFLAEGAAVFEKKISVLGVPLVYLTSTTANREVIKQLSKVEEVTKVNGFGDSSNS